MPNENAQSGEKVAEKAPMSLRARVVDWAIWAWRPAGTLVAVGLALLLGWHVVNGRHGLSVWEQKRVEDHQLRQEIQGLQQENSRLREHIQRLQSDPDAIEHEAREKLHYARPGEVIYTLPAQPEVAPQPAEPTK